MFKKLMVCTLMLALFVPALALGMASVETEGYPLNIIDVLGREVTIAAQPERIISLSPSNTEILFALGLGDKVIGVDSWSNYPAETADIEKMGDYTGANIELIIAKQPDVVFADNTIQADTITNLEALGIQVVATGATTYADIVDAITMVAQVAGADPQPVLDTMAATEAQALQLTATADTATPLKIYTAISYGEWGDWTSGTGTFISDMMAMLNATNLGDEYGAGWLSCSLEKLLADDPDVILIPGDQAFCDAFIANESYATLSAIKNGHVYAIDPDMSQRPSPRIVDAMLQIANIIAPLQTQAVAAA